MAKVTDLYPILRAFSRKNKSPYIQIEPFLDYLEKYATRKVQEQPEWEKWLKNTAVRFWSELSGIAESEKCLLMEDASGGQVYMTYYFFDILHELYTDPDKVSDVPFPGEEILSESIPEKQLKIIHLKADMNTFFESPDDPNPRQIIKLILPEGCGSILLLQSMIPRTLLEFAMLKVRHYLNSHGNKEYALNRLTPQFHGSEKYLRELLEHLIVRPMECLNTLEQSDNFSYVFWNHFCNLVRNDISKRNETMSEDMAAIQAVHVIDVCNSIYRSKSVKKKELETAFRNLEQCMGKMPCYYTREEIAKFRSDKGLALLDIYSQQELDEYIKKATMESKDKTLPEWFIINGENGVQWYLKKEKYLPICANMLIAARPLIKKEITKRWTKLLKEFRSEPAMEKDPEFEKLLKTLTVSIKPPLMTMLEDQKLLWAFEEMEKTQDTIPATLRIFKSGKLLPMSSLYVIRRKDMLTDAKILLPFWYTFPIISGIMAFFRKLKKKKSKKPTSELSDNEFKNIEETVEGNAKTIKELRSIAESIKAEMVPPNKSMEMYMEELISRWNRIIDEKSRQNLIIDVQSLTRDNLRSILKIQRANISRSSINEAVVRIINGTPSLRSLSNQESLCLYMELHMVKLILKLKKPGDKLE